jgi:hypothetical protein
MSVGVESKHACSEQLMSVGVDKQQEKTHVYTGEERNPI